MITATITYPELINYTDSSHFDNLTPNGKLDECLRVMEKTYRDFGEIQQFLKLPFNPSVHYDLENILEKLEKDGYVLVERLELDYKDFGHEKRPPTGVWAVHYKLTFEGEVFRSNGGYSTEQTALRNKNRKENVREILLISGTWAAAIAAFLFFCVEIYKIKNPPPSDKYIQVDSQIVKDQLQKLQIELQSQLNSGSLKSNNSTKQQ